MAASNPAHVFIASIHNSTFIGGLLNIVMYFDLLVFKYKFNFD